MNGRLDTPAGVSLVTYKQEAEWMEGIPNQQGVMVYGCQSHLLGL